MFLTDHSLFLNLIEDIRNFLGSSLTVGQANSTTVKAKIVSWILLSFLDLTFLDISMDSWYLIVNNPITKNGDSWSRSNQGKYDKRFFCCPFPSSLFWHSYTPLCFQFPSLFLLLQRYAQKICLSIWLSQVTDNMGYGVIIFH